MHIPNPKTVCQYKTDTFFYWYQDLQRKLRVAEVSLKTHAEAASNYTDEKSATGGSNSKSAKKKGGKKGNSDKAHTGERLRLTTPAGTRRMIAPPTHRTFLFTQA